MQTQGNTANADRHTLGATPAPEQGGARVPKTSDQPSAPCPEFGRMASQSGAVSSQHQKTIIACKKNAHGLFSDVGRAWSADHSNWSDIANAIRINSPDAVLNHGTQFLFGLQVAGNLLGIYGAHKFYNYIPELGHKSFAMKASAWSSLATNSIGIVFEEKPPTVEDRKREDNMSWLEYIPRRTFQALMPWNHVDATVSMGMIYGGVTGVIGAPSRSMAVKNSLTTAGGALLCFDPDRERAWQNSSGLFLFQKMFSINDAYQAYFNGFPKQGIAAGNWTDAVKLSLYQVSNIMGVLYGGVHVDKEGNIYKEANIKDAKAPDVDDAVLESRVNAPIDFKRPSILKPTQEESAPTSKVHTNALEQKPMQAQQQLAVSG